MRTAAMMVAVVLAACGGASGPGSGGVTGGGSGDAPFVAPFTAVSTGTPYGYTQAWEGQDARDIECTNALLVRARNLLLGQSQGGAVQTVVDTSRVPELFDSSTVWFYQGQPGSYSAVANETDAAWAPLGNYERESTAQEGVWGDLEVETKGLALIHLLLHHYEVRAEGKTVRETMAHRDWDAKGYSALSDAWSASIAATPCLAANPDGGTVVP